MLFFMTAYSDALAFRCETDPSRCAVVQTPSFRCLAFKDESGWHDAYHPSGPPLTVVKIEYLQKSAGSHLN
jgi:hypothetical protein